MNSDRVIPSCNLDYDKIPLTGVISKTCKICRHHVPFDANSSGKPIVGSKTLQLKPLKSGDWLTFTWKNGIADGSNDRNE